MAKKYKKWETKPKATIPTENNNCVSVAVALLENEPQTQEWIRCKDRLPEEEDMYLVSGKMKYASEKEYEYFIDFADYRKDFPYAYKGEYGPHFDTYNDWYEGQDEYEILAWMPLSDPLEE